MRGRSSVNPGVETVKLFGFYEKKEALASRCICKEVC